MSTQAPSSREAVAPGQRYGGHSRSAPLRRVLVRVPAPPVTGDEWRALNYLHPVDHEKTLREHAAFRAILEGAGVEVVAAGPDPDGLLDAIFADDSSILTNHGLIVVRPGKVARQPEAALAEASFTSLGVPVLGRITAPGTLEGGDTCWLDEQTFAVGRGYRTNDEGIRQLTEIMAGIGVSVVRVDLPHWHGPDECLHLLSMISPVASEVAVVYPPLMPTWFLQDLQDRGWTLIEVPEEEFDSMGGNVLPLGDHQVLMIEGNPVTKQRLEDAGFEVLTYAGDEISLNRTGGPTCLTREIWRETA